MTLLQHLRPIVAPPPVSRADIDAAFLKMVDAQRTYNAARQTWADYHPVCIDAFKQLSYAKHEYIRITVTWFRQTAVLS
jgi:hypothetical protein